MKLCLYWLIDGNDLINLTVHHISLILSGPRKGQGWVYLMALLVMNFTIPSPVAIKVASEAHSKEEVTISMVIPGNLKDLIKVLPDVTPDPPPNLSIETKTTALLVTSLVVIKLEVLNVMVPQLVLRRPTIFWFN